MIRNMLPAMIIAWFIKSVFAEAIVLGITWGINQLTSLTISYGLVGGVIAALFVLGLIGSLYTYRGTKQTFDKMKESFDDDFFK